MMLLILQIYDSLSYEKDNPKYERYSEAIFFFLLFFLNNTY